MNRNIILICKKPGEKLRGDIRVRPFTHASPLVNILKLHNFTSGVNLAKELHVIIKVILTHNYTVLLLDVCESNYSQ